MNGPIFFFFFFQSSEWPPLSWLKYEGRSEIFNTDAVSSKCYIRSIFFWTMSFTYLIAIYCQSLVKMTALYLKKGFYFEHHLQNPPHVETAFIQSLMMGSRQITS